jgi:hypothetical protein
MPLLSVGDSCQESEPSTSFPPRDLQHAGMGHRISPFPISTCRSIGRQTSLPLLSQASASYPRMSSVRPSLRVTLIPVAQISVSALGQVRYTNSFNPCDYNITQLCPIPEGAFHASGNFSVPSSYADQIPSIAFSIPDVPPTTPLSPLR